LAIPAMQRIGRQIGAGIVARDLPLRTNALTGYACGIVRTIVAAHAAVVHVRGQIDATGVVLLAKYRAHRARALARYAHAIRPAAIAAHPAVVGIARKIRARAGILTRDGSHGTRTALSGHTRLTRQTRVFAIAAILGIARKVRAARRASDQAGITYAQTTDTRSPGITRPRVSTLTNTGDAGAFSAVHTTRTAVRPVGLRIGTQARTGHLAIGARVTAALRPLASLAPGAPVARPRWAAGR